MPLQFSPSMTASSIRASARVLRELSTLSITETVRSPPSPVLAFTMTRRFLLIPNSSCSGSVYSPSGCFIYDDHLLIGQDPLISNPGLLFNTSSGLELNNYSNGPGSYTTYISHGLNAASNFPLTQCRFADGRYSGVGNSQPHGLRIDRNLLMAASPNGIRIESDPQSRLPVMLDVTVLATISIIQSGAVARWPP